MENKLKKLAQLKDAKTVEALPGIFRTTMSYSDEVMLCHFILKEGSSIPLHNHEAVQSGYVVRGKVRFLRKDSEGFEAVEGTGYLFESDEWHGAEAIEESEIIECFSPMRPEYAD
jgi:quercetin dioxygenase-like cupin family protein